MDTLFLVEPKPALPQRQGLLPRKTAVTREGLIFHYVHAVDPGSAGDYFTKGWHTTGVVSASTTVLLPTDAPYPHMHETPVTLLYSTTHSEAQKSAIERVINAWKKGQLVDRPREKFETRSCFPQPSFV